MTRVSAALLLLGILTPASAQNGISSFISGQFTRNFLPPEMPTILGQIFTYLHVLAAVTVSWILGCTLYELKIEFAYLVFSLRGSETFPHNPLVDNMDIPM
ncbi:hypothetical protein RR46_07396 [Papilio xuthus]|uniref:Uncharacterized protein n=1 Tax=Papilio xuthus TaxID=66420 RepID=A0A194PY23_PAPXU|nr:hypothetical protein RR46_07396 [Papilio xuthus]